MGQTEATKGVEEQADDMSLSEEHKKGNEGLGTVDDYPWFKNMANRSK